MPPDLCAAAEQSGRGLNQAVGRLDAVRFHQFDGAHGREMAALLVGGPDLERSDDLAITLEVRERYLARLAAIAAAQRPRSQMLLQSAVEGPRETP